jgi:pilus assembly protein CpaC
MLRVRVAEVSRSEVQNFGINLSSIFTRGSFTFGMFTGRNFLGAGGALIDTTNDSIRLGGNSGRFVVDSVIDALETEGLLKTLAEPNLTAKSGTAASFLAGGEFPIPVPQEGGAIGIEYREYGVSLEFTPTVLSNDKISLQVAPEVSTLVDSTVDIAAVNVPGLATRRASTTVELGSGESFAIAGLLQNNSSNNVNKFPWLGDLPVLGALFRSNEFQNDETELVIIVTPYIVSGVEEPNELALPTEGLDYGNDFERIFLGELYKSSQSAGRDENVDYIDGSLALNQLFGNPGFILEE